MCQVAAEVQLRNVEEGLMFFQKVNHSSRKAMVDFLVKHPRYWTMNSWNQLHSYAHNVKLRHLELDRELTVEQRGVAQEFVFMEHDEEPWTSIEDACLEFSCRHDRDYEIGTNGRYSGYMVLFQTEKKPSQYRSWCTRCGQDNYCRVVPEPEMGMTDQQIVELRALNAVRLGIRDEAIKLLEWTDDHINALLLAIRKDVEVNGRWTSNKCGRCGTVEVMCNYKQPRVDVRAKTVGLDQDRDFEDWSMHSLRQRVDLVQDFDRCVDTCRDIFIEGCKTLKVVEQQIMVSKTVKTVVPVEADNGNSGKTGTNAG